MFTYRTAAQSHARRLGFFGGGWLNFPAHKFAKMASTEAKTTLRDLAALNRWIAAQGLFGECAA